MEQDRYSAMDWEEAGLSCKAFAMRLMLLGCRSYFVGETTTTAIQKGDLLLLCSGSGEPKR